MRRLIDADAFKKENERLLHCDFPYITETTLEELIDEAPTIAAEPVRHGKWIEHVDDRWGASHYSCSECGKPPLKEERTNRRCLSNFCPNCGARMDRE